MGSPFEFGPPAESAWESGLRDSYGEYGEYGEHGQQEGGETGMESVQPAELIEPETFEAYEEWVPEASEALGEVPTGTLGALISAVPGRPTLSYRFTPEDVLWMARFIVGETGGRDDLATRAVIWAMFNLFRLLAHRYYPTFHAFLRSYSSPLQAVLRNKGAARRHMNNPDFVRVGGTYEGTTIPRGQLGRFLRLQATPWIQLPATARSLALRAAKGQIASPIGNATEFANTRVYFRDSTGRNPASYDEWRRFTTDFARRRGLVWIGNVPGLNQAGGNTFFIRQTVATLPRGAVRIALPAVRGEVWT